MWITIVWPSGRQRRKWMRSLRELDRLIGVHQAWGMTVDLESADTGPIRMIVSSPGAGPDA